jgi:hypothetical protein
MQSSRDAERLFAGAQSAQTGNAEVQSGKVLPCPPLQIPIWGGAGGGVVASTAGEPETGFSRLQHPGASGDDASAGLKNPVSPADSDPIHPGEGLPAVDLSDAEVADLLRPYLSPPGGHNPAPPLFAGHPYPERLNFLLRHAPAIAAARFPIDDHLEALDRRHGKRSDPGAYKLLYLAGVRGEMLLNLARRHYAAPDYVRSQMARGLDRGDLDERLLITRIQEHDPPRAVHPVTGHLMDCDCPACTQARYAACERCLQWPCVCGLFDASGALVGSFQWESVPG